MFTSANSRIRASVVPWCDALWKPVSTPLPGYTRAEAVSVDRNGTAQGVWWKGGPDVSSLAGRPVRLRFAMRSAKLYAFQIAEER